MPDENRVFDVARPGHSSPDTTSKPIIVGHRPTMSDPMVTDTHDSAGSYIETSPTQIAVTDKSEDQSPLETHPTEKSITPEPDNSSAWITPPAFGTDAHDTPPGPDLGAPDPQPEPAAAEAEPESTSSAFSTEPPAENEGPSDTVPSQDQPIEPVGHLEGIHVSEPKPKSKLGLVVLSILVLLVGAYLVLDSGLIKSGINLPFHVFKQKTASPNTPAASQPQNNSAATTALPAGFTEYKLAGTSLTFAAPTAWGEPSSSTDAGFSARSATAKSDGTYAYLVDFATNKDVQIAVTSSKYLPAARTSFYYDFLQWCTGTNDGKFYMQTMHFTTSADKTDTPATVSCDYGPLDAQKIDTTSLVEPKVKGTDAKTVIGDIYIKNLDNKDLPAFRVKDAAMTNGSDIKQLLNTVKIPAGSATGSPASQ